MTTLQTLHETFAELERRADVMAERTAVTGHEESAPMVGLSPADQRGRIIRRTPLLAAAAVTVAAVAIPTSLLLGRGGDVHQATTPGRSLPATVHASVVPRTTTAPPTTRTTRPTSRVVVPRSPAALAHKLRSALAGSATFTWTALVPHQPVIGGVLTEKATGRQGGFDLQIDLGTPGDKAFCEDAETSHCVISTLPDGSSLSVGHESVGGSGELYLVNLVRPDGVTLLMHVSNLANPKGGGAVLGDKPPLSINQIVTLLRSRVW